MIVRKDSISFQLKVLQEEYDKLKALASGQTPDTNECHQYNCEAKQFEKEYTDIEMEQLLYAIKFFKVAVDELKTIKSKKAPRNGAS